MEELGGLDIGTPDEGQGGVSEQASEAAQQRFAGTQAALQQLQKEEKKAKKRDGGVAGAILQFLTDNQRTHLATLIARLVAINCPSPFILAILSLINENCKTVVEEYLRENNVDTPAIEVGSRSVLPEGSKLDSVTNEQLVAWIMRMELVLNADEEAIVQSLLVDDSNIDGTVLQLTTFVLQEFLKGQGKNPNFEPLQQLSVGVLQSLFGPAMQSHQERLLTQQAENPEEESV